ncbi:MAG: hypothetical protein CUN49_03625, partial [Candidatus Thermofonsia Clade 1 bacterium]
MQDVSTLLANEARDEAIGHCKHILETFPKHLQTYRLLGQALFERGQLADAIDVFRRILAAVPDDRDAHLYLCEIYTGEQNYNAAAFHLERVWELAPEDPDIQDELKKLYAKRDGEAPPVLQLTAPVLARRYFNGKLYAEAAAELYALLERYPERHDLRGLLAQTLWLDDRPEEATEVALQLLKALPDHLIANRIMAELWLLMQRPSDARPFVHRLQALDPYLAWQIVHGEAVPVPENAFLLDRLDWRAKSASLALDVSGIGDVFSSLDSISLSESSAPAFETSAKPSSGRLLQRQTDTLPDWLEDEPSAKPAFVMPDWSELETAQEDLPDWLADEQPVASSAAAWSAPSAAQEDLPDWLADEQPVTSSAAAWSAPSTAQEDLPDWLADEQPVASSAAAWSAPSTAQEDLPDWLADEQLIVEPSAEETFDFETLAASAPSETAQVDAEFDFAAIQAGAPDLTALQATEAGASLSEPAESAVSELDLDWLSAAPDLSAAQADESASEPAESAVSELDLDWLSAAPDLSAAQADEAPSEPAESAVS